MNNETDKVEQKKKAKQKQRFDVDEKESDCILHGYIKKLGVSFGSFWQTRYAKLYPNRYSSNYVLLNHMSYNLMFLPLPTDWNFTLKVVIPNLNSFSWIK